MCFGSDESTEKEVDLPLEKILSLSQQVETSVPGVVVQNLTRL